LNKPLAKKKLNVLKKIIDKMQIYKLVLYMVINMKEINPLKPLEAKNQLAT